MKNGQPKAGYNMEISTAKQYIVNYHIHANPTDTLKLMGHYPKQGEFVTVPNKDDDEYNQRLDVKVIHTG